MNNVSFNLKNTSVIEKCFKYKLQILMICLSPNVFSDIHDLSTIQYCFFTFPKNLYISCNLDLIKIHMYNVIINYCRRETELSLGHLTCHERCTC
jgi:hypothetical protein